MLKSHLTRGAWIEIAFLNFVRKKIIRRTSHEVRGLKLISFSISDETFSGRTSHEVRGLKSGAPFGGRAETGSRTSHEVRGLKSPGHMIRRMDRGRTSHEVRGLKSWDMYKENEEKIVAPHTRCVD